MDSKSTKEEKQQINERDEIIHSIELQNQLRREMLELKNLDKEVDNIDIQIQEFRIKIFDNKRHIEQYEHSRLLNNSNVVMQKEEIESLEDEIKELRNSLSSAEDTLKKFLEHPEYEEKKKNILMLECKIHSKNCALTKALEGLDYMKRCLQSDLESLNKAQSSLEGNQLEIDRLKGEIRLREDEKNMNIHHMSYDYEDDIYTIIQKKEKYLAKMKNDFSIKVDKYNDKFNVDLEECLKISDDGDLYLTGLADNT